jgi:glycosyltransferase involved in cell wall biosynthesis
VGELIQEGKTGFLFTPGDVDDFLGAVKKMDAQKEDFAGRIDEIRATIAPFALEHFAERLTQEIEGVLERRRT